MNMCHTSGERASFTAIWMCSDGVVKTDDASSTCKTQEDTVSYTMLFLQIAMIFFPLSFFLFTAMSCWYS